MGRNGVDAPLKVIADENDERLGAGASLITESNDQCLNQSDGSGNGLELMNIGIVDSEANGSVLGQRAAGHVGDR